jgi:hypothetical protein
MHAKSQARSRPQVLTIALAILTTLIVIAPPRDAWAVSGPISVTAMGGFYSGGIDEPFLGAGVKVGLGGLSVTPYAEYLFVSNGNAYSINADLTMPIMPLGVASIYAGAGAGVLFVDPDNADSDSNSVINFLVGAGLNAVPMKPYGQVKYVVTDGDDPFVFTVGVRF